MKQVGPCFSLTVLAALDELRGVEHPPVRLDYAPPPSEPPVSATTVGWVIAFYLGVIFCLIALVFVASHAHP
jgi:hypothetical protein